MARDGSEMPVHATARRPALRQALAGALGLDPAALALRQIADRRWEREWLKDFHALRFGRRLWICPRHERVDARTPWW